MNFQRKPVTKTHIETEDFTLLAIKILLVFGMTKVNYPSYTLCSHQQQIFINVWERNSLEMYLNVTLENYYNLKSKERGYDSGDYIIYYQKPGHYKRESRHY